MIISEIYGKQSESEMYIFDERDVKVVNGRVGTQKRKTPNGRWKKRKTIEVENSHGNGIVGFRADLEYREGQGEGTKTNWRMHEYYLNQVNYLIFELQ